MWIQDPLFRGGLFQASMCQLLQHVTPSMLLRQQDALSLTVFYYKAADMLLVTTYATLEVKSSIWALPHDHEATLKVYFNTADVKRCNCLQLPTASCVQNAVAWTSQSMPRPRQPTQKPSCCYQGLKSPSPYKPTLP